MTFLCAASAACRRKSGDKVVRDPSNIGRRECPGLADHLDQNLWPGHPHTVLLEGFGEEFPICLNEAGGGEQRDVGSVQSGSDGFDLPTEPVSDFGSISPSYVEAFVSFEPSPEISLLDSALVVLGIDDPKTGRRNDEVIDISSRTGGLAIVDEESAIADFSDQVGGESSFAF
jgi:hypothetical protein